MGDILAASHGLRAEDFTVDKERQSVSNTDH